MNKFFDFIICKHYYKSIGVLSVAQFFLLINLFEQIDDNRAGRRNIKSMLRKQETDRIIREIKNKKKYY